MIAVSGWEDCKGISVSWMSGGELSALRDSSRIFEEELRLVAAQRRRQVPVTGRRVVTVCV